MRPGQVQLPFATGRGGDLRAGRVGELHEEDAETAGRRRDQRPFARSYAGALGQAQRGDAVVQQRGGLTQVQPVGHRDQVLGLHRDPLGVAPVVPRVTRDTPADPPGVHALTHGDHLPGHPVPWHVRWPHCEVLTAEAGPDRRLDEQHVRDGHRDDRLTGPGHRVRHLRHRQDLGPAEPLHPYRAHIDHRSSRFGAVFNLNIG